MLRFFSFISLVIFLSVFLSCRKDDEIKVIPPTSTPTPPVSVNEEGELIVNFKALVNGKPLVADTEWYTNTSQDSFTVTKFNYFISNVKLKKSDGSVFVEKNSYHLNKHVGGSESFTITGIPVGIYSSIEFLIGVDSVKNVSGAQSGILSEGEDMYWTWSTGYIFYKLEGKYKTSIQTDASPYGLHVGGFQGGDNCLRKLVLDLKAISPSITKQKSSRLLIDVNLERVFDGPSVISLNEYSSIFNSKMGQTVASNYESMFIVTNVEN